MKQSIIIAATLVCKILLLVSSLVHGDEPRSNQNANAAKSSEKTGADSSKTAGEKGSEGKESPDEIAIRKTAHSYIEAFSKANARDAAAHFTETAEYVDAQGTLIRGRQAVEELLTATFAAHPGCKLTLQINDIRFVTPDVAIEDGSTRLTFGEDREPLDFDYTAVNVKKDGKWLTASLREHMSNRSRQHHEQLQQLNWLLGDWVHEGDDSIVRFSCRSVDNGTFLVRTFTVQMEGRESITGTQRIGWDPLAGKLRAWVFDSEGGFSEGYWHRDGDDWVLKMTGVTPDGDSASSTSIYSLIDARTMSFRSVDHEVAGIELPDSEPVTIVRKFPAPE